MGIKKKDLKCMSKNKKCMECLKSKNSKKFISGKSIKGSTTMFDLHDYGCNKKCKSCKEEEKKGGGLPDVLIPLGLIVAREYGPKLVRSLKRRLTKKGGRKRRRTVRKRRRTRKGKRSRKTLRGGNFGSCSRCHVGGSKSEQKEANKVTAKKIAQQAMKESKQLPAAVKAKISLASKKAARTIPLKKNINSTPLDKLIEDMETFSKEMKTNILQEKSQLPKDQQTPGGQQVKKIVDKYISELNRKSMLVKQASDKLGGKRRRTKGKSKFVGTCSRYFWCYRQSCSHIPRTSNYTF